MDMPAGQGDKNQVKTISRKKFIASQLRRGKVPAQVIELVMEKYGLGKDQSYQLVYNVNKEINDSLKELYDNVADYLVRNLQSLASEALEDKDRKSALKAYEQFNDGTMTDFIPTDEDLQKGFDGIPKFPGNEI